MKKSKGIVGGKATSKAIKKAVKPTVNPTPKNSAQKQMKKMNKNTNPAPLVKMSTKAVKKPMIKTAPPVKSAPVKSAAPATKGKVTAPIKPPAAKAKTPAPKTIKTEVKSTVKSTVKPAAKGFDKIKTEAKELAKKLLTPAAKYLSGKDEKAPKIVSVESKAPKGKTSGSAAVLTTQAPSPIPPKGKKETKKAAAIEAALLAAANMCRENACENQATTKGYCRLDYIKNWKKIKRKEMILKEGKLNNYIEELVSKYPDKYIDIIRQDLSTEVSFNKVIHDLELDESIDDLDYDGDSIDSLIGSVKKEEGFDDDEF